MLKARLAPNPEIRQYLKAYYRYKRLLEHLDGRYELQLAEMQAENPKLFARLEANNQANS